MENCAQRNEVSTANVTGNGAMFDGIAKRYDLLNTVLSFGLHRAWRKAATQALALAPGQRVLDVATGTGDLAIDVARAADVSVVGLDPSKEMLALAEPKLERAGLGDRVKLVFGDALALPFEDHRFDAVCVAFGVRNFTDRPRALKEMTRVLAPSGRLAILELSEPKGGLLGAMARIHIHQVVPRLGAWLSSRKEYRYLEDSIERFPSPDVFLGMLDEAGLQHTSYSRLSFGACVLYTGVAS